MHVSPYMDYPYIEPAGFGCQAWCGRQRQMTMVSARRFVFGRKAASKAGLRCGRWWFGYPSVVAQHLPMSFATNGSVDARPPTCFWVLPRTNGRTSSAFIDESVV